VSARRFCRLSRGSLHCRATLCWVSNTPSTWAAGVLVRPGPRVAGQARTGSSHGRGLDTKNVPLAQGLGWPTCARHLANPQHPLDIHSDVDGDRKAGLKWRRGLVLYNVSVQFILCALRHFNCRQ
jgi:hypothetical protein